MTLLYGIILAIIEAVLGALVNEAEKPKNTAVDASSNATLRARLLKRVREAKNRAGSSGGTGPTS